MDNDQQIQTLTEIMQRDDDIARLNQKVYQLTRENTSMRKTIDTVLRIKCKRGEGAFALNIDLKACVNQNATRAIRHGISSHAKTSDIASYILLHTLIGLEGIDIPCAILHSPQYTIVYKEDGLWIVCTLSEFTDMLYKCMRNHVMEYSRDYARSTDPSDTYIDILNTLLNAQQFTACVKTMVKLYKDY